MTESSSEYNALDKAWKDFVNYEMLHKSDQAGKVMFFKGILLDFDTIFVKIADQKLGETLVAINSIKRIEECE